MGSETGAPKITCRSGPAAVARRVKRAIEDSIIDSNRYLLFRNRTVAQSWRRTCLLAGFTAALLGLTIQSCIALETFSLRGYGLGASVLKLLSYFTILTNLLVLVSHGTMLAAPRTRFSRMMASSAFSSAVLLYITSVCSLYTLLLANTWHPAGLQWVANLILHYLTPLFYVVFWVLFTPKSPLPWRLALVWLIYPLVYLGWVLCRGAVLGDYPYLFMNPAALGYPRMLEWTGGLALVFLFSGCAVIAGNRLMHGLAFRRKVAG